MKIKKITIIILMSIMLVGCNSKNEEIDKYPSRNSKVVDFHGNEISISEIPILVEDIEITNVKFYPLAGIPNYYGIQASVINNSDFSLGLITVSYAIKTESEELSIMSRFKEEEICQLGCEKPVIHYEGSMYYEGSYEDLEKNLRIEEIIYGVKSNDFIKYNFDKQEYYRYFEK